MAALSRKMTTRSRKAGPANYVNSIIKPSDGKSILTKERSTTMAHYDPTSLKAEDFIHHEEILDTLRYAEHNTQRCADRQHP